MPDESDRALLLRNLPDEPFTVVARHFLRTGTGATKVARDAAGNLAAGVVIAPWAPTEPMGFGSDVDALVRLLLDTPGWNCVNVAASTAPRLAEQLGKVLGLPTRFLDDVYFVLDGPPRPVPLAGVRLLGPDDRQLLEGAPPELQGDGPNWAGTLLKDGIVAGALVGGVLATRVTMEAHSERYAEIGAVTIASARNRGYATAGTALVSNAVQQRGYRAVWSTGGHNRASQRVAAKVGFHEVGRESYVIFPELQRSGGYRPVSR